jgi:hypothetical protein
MNRLRALPDTVTDNVLALRALADEMARSGNEYALEVHALAVDLIEGLNIDREESK